MSIKYCLKCLNQKFRFSLFSPESLNNTGVLGQNERGDDPGDRRRGVYGSASALDILLVEEKPTCDARDRGVGEAEDHQRPGAAADH